MKACFEAAKTWMQVSTSSNTVAIKITFFNFSDAFIGYISCDELIYFTASTLSLQKDRTFAPF